MKSRRRGYVRSAERAYRDFIIWESVEASVRKQALELEGNKKAKEGTKNWQNRPYETDDRNQESWLYA
jgi:hypothetical protein